MRYENTMTKKQRKQRHKQKHSGSTDSIQPQPAAIEKTPNTPHNEPMCLYVKTSELFQPVRLYYRVSRPAVVLNTFLHLHCMEFGRSQNCWFWLYTGEAQSLRFQCTISDADQPFILGYCWLNKHFMYLDVHSIEQALAAIPFFDAHLPKKAAKISHLGIINRLFEGHELSTFSFDNYFRADLHFNNPALKITAKLLWLTLLTWNNRRKRMVMVDQFIQKDLNKPAPEVEYIGIRYYQEGLHQLQFMLASRQHVAIKHWQGNSEYTDLDYAAEAVRHILEKEHTG